MANKHKSTLNCEKITNFTHFLVMPLKLVGCWDWFPNPQQEYEIIINSLYLCMVLFVLTNLPIMLMINLYTEWTDVMGSLEKLADGLPLVVSLAIVGYFSTHKKDLYELVDYMNDNFVVHSARGLTNMTMERSYKAAKNFAYIYTACTMFSVMMYAVMPIFVHLWTKQPIQFWVYMDITRIPFFVTTFLRHTLGQAFIGLAMGQLGVFFAANSILLCGQLDLVCCSLRNARQTALLRCGVQHAAVRAACADLADDETHMYIYNRAEMEDSVYHYDKKMFDQFVDRRTQFDIYSTEFDEPTTRALRECARAAQVVAAFRQKFERFVSPLLVLRVFQVTMYLCTLLYAATLKFDMMTVEYLAAVALDIFVYCYYGNQIILQADRVTTAAYQSWWAAMGARPRALLLNILLAHRRPATVRAGGFLPMDLRTFVTIIRTSFSYYTLLVNVNENKK